MASRLPFWRLAMKSWFGPRKIFTMPSFTVVENGVHSTPGHTRQVYLRRDHHMCTRVVYLSSVQDLPGGRSGAQTSLQRRPFTLAPGLPDALQASTSLSLSLDFFRSLPQPSCESYGGSMSLSLRNLEVRPNYISALAPIQSLVFTGDYGSMS